MKYLNCLDKNLKFKIFGIFRIQKSSIITQKFKLIIFKIFFLQLDFLDMNGSLYFAGPITRCETVMDRFMLANVIASFENMAMAIATLKMATFIMAFGEKVAWMSMGATGGKQREAFMLGIGKKAADMVEELYFLGLDIKKRPAFFKHPNGKKT